MSGSNENEISWSELMKFAAGTADDETHARVSQALDDKDHPVSYLMRRSHGLNNAPDVSIHDAEPAVLTSKKWLNLPLNWSTTQFDLFAASQAIIDGIAQTVGLMPLPEFSKGGDHKTEGGKKHDELLRSHLLKGNPVIAANQEGTQWLHVAIQDQQLLLRVGRNSSHRFNDFAIDFCLGDEIVLSVESESGVISVDLKDFEAVATKTDKLIIRQIS